MSDGWGVGVLAALSLEEGTIIQEMWAGTPTPKRGLTPTAPRNSNLNKNEFSPEAFR